MSKKKTSKWWAERETAVREAIHDAEEATGHQILVRVGKLGHKAPLIADAVAHRFHAASLVLCVDPVRRQFEIRWPQHVALDRSAAAGKARDCLAHGDLAGAIRSLATLLPIDVDPLTVPLDDIIEE